MGLQCKARRCTENEKLSLKEDATGAGAFVCIGEISKQASQERDQDWLLKRYQNRPLKRDIKTGPPREGSKRAPQASDQNWLLKRAIKTGSSRDGSSK